MHFNRVCWEAVYTGTPQRSREETMLQPGFCYNQRLCGWAGFTPELQSPRSPLDALEGLKMPNRTDKFCGEKSHFYNQVLISAVLSTKQFEGRMKKKQLRLSLKYSRYKKQNKSLLEEGIPFNVKFKVQFKARGQRWCK